MVLVFPPGVVVGLDVEYFPFHSAFEVREFKIRILGTKTIRTLTLEELTPLLLEMRMINDLGKAKSFVDEFLVGKRFFYYLGVDSDSIDYNHPETSRSIDFDRNEDGSYIVKYLVEEMT